MARDRLLVLLGRVSADIPRALVHPPRNSLWHTTLGTVGPGGEPTAATTLRAALSVGWRMAQPLAKGSRSTSRGSSCRARSMSRTKAPTKRPGHCGAIPAVRDREKASTEKTTAPETTVMMTPMAASNG